MHGRRFVAIHWYYPQTSVDGGRVRGRLSVLVHPLPRRSRVRPEAFRARGRSRSRTPCGYRADA
ncbi:hypothetical protein AZ78_0271 [Lysobacter capsici AZ78]|uniref:Uncharacterized protein n=1 Tax=Lysobacter capsici AZ78 TaxID=1444315 RepID=A0A108U549_9GAMM|nr:hypothetical protein AZ78_0271 [Lysobacter capsici AZ78]